LPRDKVEPLVRSILNAQIKRADEGGLVAHSGDHEWQIRLFHLAGSVADVTIAQPK
jgi:hypothetical protein